MGMEQTVTFPAGPAPDWPAVRDLLASHGFPVTVRMIDGELAFPDEAPPDAWRELRVGTPLGMVTLRRVPAGLVCVTWGNADIDLTRAWNALTWAAAAAGGGTVRTPDGPRPADEYRRTADLPPAIADRAGGG